MEKRMGGPFRSWSVLAAAGLEQLPGLRHFLEGPARPIGGRLLVQDGLQLLARLRVAAPVDVEPGPLAPHARGARGRARGAVLKCASEARRSPPSSTGSSRSMLPAITCASMLFGSSWSTTSTSFRRFRRAMAECSSPLACDHEPSVMAYHRWASGSFGASSVARLATPRARSYAAIVSGPLLLRWHAV